MPNLTNITITEANELLKKKEISAVELVEAHLKRAEEFANLNAFTELLHDKAVASAQESQKRIDAGQGRLIDGIPIGVKDLFCMKGVKTTSCSKILDNFTPSYESTVTEIMRNNGGIAIGKTNMDEFAMGSANTNSHYGSVLNPWSLATNHENLVPGGSSGGSAAAVAAELCMGALGSDTGGSIRQPAAFCGLVGLKPSYGRCSRYGMISFASSLDQAGVLTRSVKDAALLLQSIWGHDAKDSTSSTIDFPDLTKINSGSVKGKKIGIPRQYRMDGMDSEIESLWHKGAKWLEEMGATIIEVDLPYTMNALPAYYIIAPAEASSNLSRYDGVRYGYRAPEYKDLDDMYSKTRAQGFGHEVKRRIMIGTYVLSAGYYDAYYVKAQRVRRLIAEDFARVFKEVDYLLTPTTPNAAFKEGEKQDDPISMYLNDVFTVPASLAGLPAMSVPVSLSKKGLPLGLQLIGKRNDEAGIVTAGLALEEYCGFKPLTI